jgi:hypothetical protein
VIVAVLNHSGRHVGRCLARRFAGDAKLTDKFSKAVAIFGATADCQAPEVFDRFRCFASDLPLGYLTCLGSSDQ